MAPVHTRRDFLRVVSAAGAGLVLGFRLPFGPGPVAADDGKDAVLNAFLRIGADDTVTVLVSQAEMGQGVYTSLPMAVAEELEVEWSRVRVEAAPASLIYANPAMGQQATGGSSSVRMMVDPMRRAGAAAREMLVAAAAAAWGVDAASCTASAGTVHHAASGKTARYGELAAAAANLPPPPSPAVKPRKDWKLLGKSMPRLDTPSKVDGSARFGLDVRVEGMLFAAVKRCPVLGGRVRTVKDEAAKSVPGVKHIVPFGNGVAVVADGTWPAMKGLDALEIEWDPGPNAALSSESIRGEFRALAEKPGVSVRVVGNAAQALAGAAKKLDAVYEVPFLHHATMEPMNATAHVRADAVDVWAPTQGQTKAQMAAAKIAGVPADRVAIHTTLLGGGFGRRFESDFVEDAVRVSKAVGAPVQVVWSREEDVRHGFYRPSTYNRLAAGLDAQGMPVAWTHRIVGPSILARVFPMAVAARPDGTSIEGAANLPYAVPHVAVDYAMKNTPVPVGFWRSVGSSQNAFVTECFFDEIAAAGGQDPFELRRRLLANAPRHRTVLERVAEASGWGKPPGAGRGRGIAVAESFGTYVAQVAEVSVSDAGAVRVERVWCAVDCGMHVNPDTIEAQMQSGIVYGLTAALYGQITLAGGTVMQSNFDDYPLLRMSETPAIEVIHILSDQPPGGVGEPGTPPIAPAVVNAIAAATGKRIRSLPVSLHDLKRS